MHFENKKMEVSDCLFVRMIAVISETIKSS